MFIDLLSGSAAGVVAALVLMLVGRRERRLASARLISEALARAIAAAQRPHLSPATAVSVPFGTYVTVWEQHRANLTRLDRRVFGAVSEAFDQLAALEMRAARGDDLREEVFDSIWEAGQSCEFARRLVAPFALTMRERVVNRTRRLRLDWHTGRDCRRVERMWLAQHT